MGIQGDEILDEGGADKWGWPKGNLGNRGIPHKGPLCYSFLLLHTNAPELLLKAEIQPIFSEVFGNNFLQNLSTDNSVFCNYLNNVLLCMDRCIYQEYFIRCLAYIHFRQCNA